MAAKRILTFTTSELVDVVKNAKEAHAHRATYDDSHNPAYNKGGKVSVLLLSVILMLFASGLLFVRSLLLWKRDVQPKTMICVASMAALAMMSIATDHWAIGVALTISAALLEGVMLFALLRWKRNKALDE